MCDNVYYAFFFFNDTATTEIYTLSLHDALPILLDGLQKYLSQSHGSNLDGNGVQTVRTLNQCLRIPAGQDAHLMSARDRKSTRLNSSHSQISNAVSCLKK